MTDTVIEIASRLRNGRAIETAEDFRQWTYEHLDNLSKDLGRDHVPADIFPIMIRVMTEWVEAVSGLDDDLDRETARALANAISELARCLNKCLARC